MVENLVEIFGRSQLYDLKESSPNALKSNESTNKNGKVNIICLKLLRFCDIILLVKCVRTAYQRKGIGLALIREGHRIAKQLGYDYSAVQDEYFMAFKLQDDAPQVKGMVKYDSAFGIY